MMLFGGMPHGHGLGGWTGLNAIVGHMAQRRQLVRLALSRRRVRGAGGDAALRFCQTDHRLDGFCRDRRAALDLGRHALRAVAHRHAGRLRRLLRNAGTYAFYRFWISSQVGDRPHVDVPASGSFAAAAGGSLLARLVLVAASGMRCGTSRLPQRRSSSRSISRAVCICLRDTSSSRECSATDAAS